MCVLCTNRYSQCFHGISEIGELFYSSHKVNFYNIDVLQKNSHDPFIVCAMIFFTKDIVWENAQWK